MKKTQPNNKFSQANIAVSKSVHALLVTRCRQNGQVLPLGLVLLVMSVVGALMLFNTGTLASDKMRLANSADAAAYSGALWQARALNYQAYANRAMVANQVAIGQAVSLQSWMSYAAVTSEHLATALSAVPVLNMVTGGFERAVALAEPGVSAGALTLLAVTNAATKALSLSQTAMHAATLVNTNEIISVVASETDKRFSTNSAYGIATKGLNASEWLDFSSQYTKKDEDAMQERQQLIMESRDKFTRSRNWNLFSIWVPTTLVSYHKLKRQGGTQLVSVKTAQGVEWEWVAKDTMSIHNKIYGWSGKKLKELPVAWASAFANSRGDNRPITKHTCSPAVMLGFRKGECIQFTKDNHLAERYADGGLPSLKTGRKTLKPMKGYGGVRPFWVLSDKARSAEDARLSVKVEVSLALKDVKESDVITKADQLKAPVVLAGNTLSALSKADVFYRRPDHHTLSKNQREKANSYNPYWQAQLVPVSQADRLAALALRSGGVTPTSRHPDSTASNNPVR